MRSVATLFPDEPPTFPAHTPNGHYDAAALEAPLRAVGFATVTTEILHGRATHAPRCQQRLDIASVRRCGLRSRLTILVRWPKRRTLWQPQSQGSLGLDKLGPRSRPTSSRPCEILDRCTNGRTAFGWVAPEQRE